MKKIRVLLISVLIFAILVPQAVWGTDRSIDGFINADQSIKYGRSLSDSPIGKDLAWGEAYSLDGYMNLYDATKERKWLDKIVDQVDRVKANAVDANGDGYLGWPDAAIAHMQAKNNYFIEQAAASGTSELISNGSFETDVNQDNIPDNWTRENGTGAVRSTISGDYYSGSAGVTITSDNNGNNYRLVQSFNYTAGATYVVEAYAGVETEKTQAVIEIYNGTTNTVINFVRVHHVGFERYVFNFTAPASGTLYVRLHLEAFDTTGYKARFDSISIKQVDSQPQELVQNNTFDYGDSGDSTLPTGWVRWNGTDSSTAYRSSGINNYYTMNYGLCIKSTNTTAKGIEQTISYSASTKYVVKFRGRVSDPRYSGRVEIYNLTTGLPLAWRDFNNYDWNDGGRYSFTFTAPSSGVLQIRCYETDYTGLNVNYYFDDISVMPAYYSDAAAWTRDVNTTLTMAHRTNTETAEWGLELVHGGGYDPIVYQYLENYKSSAAYSFAGWFTLSSGATAIIRAYDETAGANLAFTTQSGSGTTARYLINFTTPSDKTHKVRLEIYMINGSPGQTLYTSYVYAGERWEDVSHDGFIGATILRFVNAVYTDTGLQSTYGAKADTYRDFIADNLFHKWDYVWQQITGTDGSNNGTGVYKFPTGFSTEWFPGRSQNHNHYLLYARMLYLLYDATNGVSKYSADRPKYLSRANDMVRNFQNNLHTNPVDSGAYTWHYWDWAGNWDSGHYYQSPYEDISHSAMTVDAFLEAYRHGQVFAITDIQKLVRTFTGVMWNGSLTNPVLSQDNSRVPQYTLDRLWTYLYNHWINLAEIDHEVWDIANAVDKTAMDYYGYGPSGVAKWSRNKLINNGFETQDPADSTLANYWSRYQSSPSTCYNDTASPYQGEYCILVKGNGVSNQIAEQKLVDYEPNTKYTVKFAYKTNGVVNAQLDVYNYTDSQLLATDKIYSGTSWTTNSFTFTTPSVEGKDIRIRLYNSDYTKSTGIVYYDEVYALPDLYNSDIPNGSFEVSDIWDSTLPQYWVRTSTTQASKAIISNDSSTSGTKCAKLTTVSGGAAQQLVYKWQGYKPGASYHITISGKADSTSAGGRLRVIDETSGTTLSTIEFTDSNWTTHTADFNAPTPYDHTLKVIIEHKDPSISSKNFWIDDLGIYLN